MTRSPGNTLAFEDDEGRIIQMAVRKLDESNTLFAVEVDMENRSPEEVAKDAAMQIGALFDRLIKDQKEKERSDER